MAIQQIQHRHTDIGSPETNGFCERFHRTAKEEFYSVVFRKAFYELLDQLQADRNCSVEFYSRERAHQGYCTQGRTPHQVLLDGIAAQQQQREGSALLKGNAVTAESRFSTAEETFQKEVTSEVA